ncbi:MAG: nodulation protein NfeD [Bdellovibrionales bacterium]|nr:nodulation protein NfeD [Bdellovibrionales bacterium]
MKQTLLVLALLLLSPFSAQAQTCTTEVNITGVIGPATLDLLKRVERSAAKDQCSSILLLVNTPGGSLETTRLIVEQILNSKIPYLCLVSPSGGHAGSAGAIILQACHVNGGLRGTNLGAATPVSMGGQEMPKDLRQKILNDTRSWLESLTGLRGRNKKFGEDIILEAKAVTAEEALKLKAIDFVGDSKDEFLKFADGRSSKLAGNEDVTVKTGVVKEFAQDSRFKVLSLLTDPELAYMLLLASLALLYFEITHSGAIFPGVAGAIGLVIALMALHKLDVEWGGLLLIFIGIGLFVAEMFLPTFGLVGAAGVVSLVLGSLFLFDPVRSFGYQLPYALIFSTVSVFAVLLVGLSFLVLKSARVRKKGGFEDLMGVSARVTSVDSGGRSGMAELRGELWKFESHADLQVNDQVVVQGHQGLVLKVEKEK